ncbi:MAG: type II toxin-antitoxin system RelE/ParE family toxin [Chloroflexi bacterium]|nr:type II toxin-antitoxin system RelE/ParE family toxin [Chloroflexota bacterium]
MVTTYRVDFSPEAETSLGRLDKQIAQRVLDRIKWLSLHVEDVNHKALTGRLRGAFKLRVGDYRVVYELKHKNSILTIRLIGHRSEVYKS